MFEIYLPIAEVFINGPLLLLISTIVGLLTGMLGIGGGFLMTPILIFFGIPPIYAVANSANNILAASVSGTLAHYFKGQLDLKMGALILIGGIIGSIIGIEIFIYFLKSLYSSFSMSLQNVPKRKIANALSDVKLLLLSIERFSIQ